MRTTSRIVILLVALCGTATAPGVRAAGNGEPTPPAAAARYRVDKGRSYIVATAGRAGVMGFLGHEHGVLATAWSAELDYDEQAPEHSSLAVEVSSVNLIVDTEAARKRARLGSGPGADDVAEIQARMLGPTLLDADDHPWIRFRSDRVEALEPGKLRVHGEFTLLETTRPVQFETTVRQVEAFTLFVAQFQIRQTDFGIQPVSIGGVVKVADEVKIRIALWTLPPE